MKKYNLYLDDTGFNAHEKQSKRLQSEKGTYVGVLIPEERIEELSNIVDGLGDLLEKKYGVREFHFTDIYNGKKPFDIMSPEEKISLLDAFGDLFQMFNLKAFVHTSTDKEKTGNEAGLDKMVEFLLEKLNIKTNEKSKAMIYSYLKSKKYLADKEADAAINKIVADEGLRKSGAVAEAASGDFKIYFQSSSEEKMLQIADYAAWFITRAKNVYDKMSSKKKISDFDEEIIKIYSKLSNSYVGLTKKHINLENLEDFDYDEIIDENTQKE